jgi:hypothetical protein
MGWKTCQWTKEIFGHFQELGFKSFPNTQMKIESKEISSHWKFGRDRKKKEAYVGKLKKKKKGICGKQQMRIPTPPA